MKIKQLIKDIEGVFLLPVKRYYFGKKKFGTPYFDPRGFNENVVSVRKLKLVKDPDFSELKVSRYVRDYSKVFKNMPMVRRNKYWIKKIFNSYYLITVGWPIAIVTINLGWKDKYETPRYEWAPSFIINFFHWQYANWWVAPVEDTHEYYEMILWYLKYSDKDIKKAEETWPWQNSETKESTWNNNYLIKTN